jgi:hypothetical protein
LPHGSYDDDVDALGHGIIWSMQHPCEEEALLFGGPSQASYWTARGWPWREGKL